MYTRTANSGRNAARRSVAQRTDERWKLNVEQVTDDRALSTRWLIELVRGPCCATWPGIVHSACTVLGAARAPSIARRTAIREAVEPPFVRERVCARRPAEMVF